MNRENVSRFYRHTDLVCMCIYIFFCVPFFQLPIRALKWIGKIISFYLKIGFFPPRVIKAWVIMRGGDWNAIVRNAHLKINKVYTVDTFDISFYIQGGSRSIFDFLSSLYFVFILNGFFVLLLLLLLLLQALNYSQWFIRFRLLVVPSIVYVYTL